ncbi:MAG: MBL fold metallo-hydrolase [Tepidisphaeraceae bacterium]|jgi:glyoxylase-like metal-dependent hydrolase (beta-lactamase superfamily II)
MKVYSNAGGIAQTNCYLVADEKAKVAVLFDAPDHTVTPLLDEAGKQGWEIIGLWLTHGHFDHMADHAVVTQRFPNAKVLVHKLDEPKIQHPNSQFPLPFKIPPRSADAYVEDGQKLSIGSLTVEVLHAPGHASGHVMYYFPAEKIIIGGDLIIMSAVGRTDLPDSSYATLQASIRRVMKLPRETTLLPGHGDPSTLADELRTNEYVREALGAAE